MDYMTPQLAAVSILEHVAEGRLTQKTWHSSDEKGRETACLLGAIHSGIQSSSDCPAQIMPPWLADKIPSRFDLLPPDLVNDVGEKFAERMSRWGDHPLDWDDVKKRFDAAIAMKLGAIDVATYIPTGVGNKPTQIYNSDDLPAADWFTLLFGVLDQVLPPQGPATFYEFSYQPEPVYITVEATNPARALIEARKLAPGKTLTPVSAPDWARQIMAKWKDGDAPPWYDNRDLFDQAQKTLGSKFHSTDLVIKEVYWLYGPDAKPYDGFYTGFYIKDRHYGWWCAPECGCTDNLAEAYVYHETPSHYRDDNTKKVPVWAALLMDKFPRYIDSLPWDDGPRSLLKAAQIGLGEPKLTDSLDIIEAIYDRYS